MVDVCHVLPWQWLLERLKLEQYSQIVELGIEIRFAFLGGYYIAMVLIRPRSYHGNGC